MQLHILITGGCGFIGSNAAMRFCKLGHRVTVFDSLARQGSEENLKWLQKELNHDCFAFIQGDVRNCHQVAQIIRDQSFDVILHLAAQVAVTTSVQNPRADFELNAYGTLNVLEAVRLFSPRTILLYASTNKVYGKLQGIEISEQRTRYALPQLPYGISEAQPLDFHSPYGCSKGAADQYMMDYARIYNLRTVNFRQSCIYGYRQFGIEDQGWLAWFVIAHLFGFPLTLFGTGKQVRDVLFIDDLVAAYLGAIEHIDKVAGETFNIGGGNGNTVSLLEFVELLSEISGQAVKYNFADWRPGDQYVYISDTRKAESLLNWRANVSVRDGVSHLHRWILENRGLLVKRPFNY